MNFCLDTPHHHIQHINVKISGDADGEQDDAVMDSVIVSCTVGDDEALVDKAGSCYGSRRRLVRQKAVTSAAKQHKQTDVILGM